MTPVMSKASQITYRVRPTRPESHQFDLELLIPAAVAEAAGGALTLALPAWIPGSYMIRDFARNIVSWAGGAGPLRESSTSIPGDLPEWRMRYPSVPGLCLGVVGPLCAPGHHSWLFQRPQRFLRVEGLQGSTCGLELLPPDSRLPPNGGWQPVCSRAFRDGGFGTYRASGYEDLIDHPVEMGSFSELEFYVRGIRHRMAITGRHRADHGRLGGISSGSASSTRPCSASCPSIAICS